MAHRLGLVMAMAAEVDAVMGRGNDMVQDGLHVRKAELDDSTEILCVRPGVGVDRGLGAGRWLAKQGVSAIVNLGVSGGLDPQLKPGAVLVAKSCTMHGPSGVEPVWTADPARVEKAVEILKEYRLKPLAAPLLTTPGPVLSTEDKARLFQDHKTLGADMESAAVAVAAREAGLPFFCLRTVCDAAKRAVPEDLVRSLARQGTVSVGFVLKKILRRPRLIIDLLRMGTDYDLALKALKRSWRALAKEGLPGVLGLDEKK